MARRLTLSLVLVAAGFVAGLAVTGRARTPGADAPVAESAPASSATGSPTATSGAEQRTAPVAAGLAAAPDFTRVAGLAVKGVANISSLQVVRTRNSPLNNDPFFRYFFGD